MAIGNTSLMLNKLSIYLSKVFDRVIHIQLYDYFCKNNLLCKQQYGFRLKHSTEFATIKLVDYLVKNMDENFIPCAIYLDLSKAFDTLNFDIPINKLKFYGIVGTPLKLLDNYLKNRHQFVDLKIPSRIYRKFELEFHKGQF